jgi:hypothetical protein
MRLDTGKIEHGTRLLLAVLWAAVLFAICLFVAASWPNYWVFIAAETTPLAWLESLLLMLTACIAALNAFVVYAAGSFDQRMKWGWLVVAAGFAWLGLDERFAVHERIRDLWLKPTGIRLLPWMEAGDLLIPVYTVCGLAISSGIWLMLGTKPRVRLWFIVSLALSAAAAGLDTIDVRSLNLSQERLLQSIEEVIETLSMTGYLSVFLSVWTGLLRGQVDNATNRILNVYNTNTSSCSKIERNRP